MDVSCPNCGASYRIPEALLAGGKKLRCSACSHQFAPLAQAPDPLPGPLPDPSRDTSRDPSPGPMTDPPWRDISVDVPAFPSVLAPLPSVPEPPPAHPVARRAATASGKARALVRPLALAWAASLAILALTLGGMVTYRLQIAEAWPPYGRVAMLIGD